ncbi:transcription initiation factor TFIID subunit 10-like isoform X1 [Miscanthus floridulus]|uniref:transcription initiation factor TFIID subunit 10-like isoform X1 n=1 Tax=Miscanthus floridulus TaxID=154761 RepID=UPI003458B544
MMSSGGGAGGPGGGMGPGVGGGGDGRHDDEAALTEFLSTLMDYTPTIPDELVEHYLGRSGFQCPDLRLTRLVAGATQKFLSDIASDSLQSDVLVLLYSLLKFQESRELFRRRCLKA